MYCPFLVLDMLELLDISMTVGYPTENLTMSAHLTFAQRRP